MGLLNNVLDAVSLSTAVFVGLVFLMGAGLEAIVSAFAVSVFGFVALLLLSFIEISGARM